MITGFTLLDGYLNSNCLAREIPIHFCLRDERSKTIDPNKILTVEFLTAVL